MAKTTLGTKIGSRGFRKMHLENILSSRFLVWPPRTSWRTGPSGSNLEATLTMGHRGKKCCTGTLDPHEVLNTTFNPKNPKNPSSFGHFWLVSATFHRKINSRNDSLSKMPPFCYHRVENWTQKHRNIPLACSCAKTKTKTKPRTKVFVRSI